MNRTYFIGGNWKSNGSLSMINELVPGLNEQKDHIGVDVVVAPMNIHLGIVSNTLRKSYQISAQNISRTNNGAFTGETSAIAMKDFGVTYTIVGHSERRGMFGDTDEVVTEKCIKALESNLKVIACLGESLEERKEGKTIDVVVRQLNAIAKGVSSWDDVVLAYEPIWAIGTGEVASAEQAQEVHAALRKHLATITNDKVAETTRIIYGGSVKSANAGSLIVQPDIDGFLVGGASLKPADFGGIIQAAVDHAAKDIQNSL